MTRNYSTGICAKVARVVAWKKPYAKKIVIELDDERTTSNRIAFCVDDSIYFPFKEGQDIILTLRKSVE